MKTRVPWMALVVAPGKPLPWNEQVLLLLEVPLNSYFLKQKKLNGG